MINCSYIIINNSYYDKGLNASTAGKLLYANYYYGRGNGSSKLSYTATEDCYAFAMASASAAGDDASASSSVSCNGTNLGNGIYQLSAGNYIQCNSSCNNGANNSRAGVLVVISGTYK